MKELSYLSGTSTSPLIGQTIGDLFDDIAERFAEEEALVVVHQNTRWTYRTLREKVDECARAFIALGVERGERVGIWSPNCYEWPLVQLATAKIGAILVNINPSYRLHELQYALNQSQCRVLVTADAFKYSNYTQMLYELAPELQFAIPGHLSSAIVPDLNTIIRLHEEPSPGMYTWAEFIRGADGVSAKTLARHQAELDFDDPINIQYTSGTTGFPKGATLSHHNILNNGFFIARRMEFTPADRLVIPVPLYHCFGMVLGNLGAITHGATMIYPSPVFDAEAVLQTIDREKATALYGVPTMFIAELEHPNFKQYDLRTLRTGIMAGAPCPVEVMKKVKTLMHARDIQIAYGMTETSPVSTQTKIGTPLEKQVGTVGQIQEHLEIKVIDIETQRIVPRGVTGEFCTRGYSVMLGYWNDPEKTEEAIDEAGWMHSGDLASIDEEGYISIVGRLKDMIIRGGENIYPREIEEFLYTHPAISEVQIIGVPDLKYGEEIMAWVKLHEGQWLDAEALREYCTGQIAHYKIPRYIKITDEFPMTATGKIRKIDMRRISIEELGLEEAAGVKTA